MWFERFLLAGCIVCATGPWRSVKISLILYRYRVRNIKKVAVKIVQIFHDIDNG